MRFAPRPHRRAIARVRLPRDPPAIFQPHVLIRSGRAGRSATDIDEALLGRGRGLALTDHQCVIEGASRVEPCDLLGREDS